MLVLTRREGDQIQIGDDITIMVVRISPHAVRIGIRAPAEAVVMRRELLARQPPPADQRSRKNVQDDA
jgi:carbon storage regulator